MTTTLHSFTTVDAVGNKEGLINEIFNVTPADTPFLDAIKKTVAKATKHEWQTDEDAAVDFNNAQVEAQVFDPQALIPTQRLNNYTQIFTKAFHVSGTQQSVEKAGRQDELAYQLKKKMKEIKRDIESALLSNTAKSPQIGSNPRRLGGLETWLKSNSDRDVAGLDPAGDGSNSAVDGSDRAFTEDQLLNVCQKIFNNSGDRPDFLMLGGYSKRVFSSFAGLGGINGQTRYNLADEMKITSTVEVYVSDFGQLKTVINRYQRPRSAFVINSDMAKLAVLRPLQSDDLPKTSDGQGKFLVYEATLEMCNEKAHGIIADLSVA